MKENNLFVNLCLVVLFVAVIGGATADALLQPPSNQAIVVINTDAAAKPYDPMIFGGFIEHFGRQIYGRVFEPGSPLADKKGFRTDVIEALKELKAPVIRWPGGCFVDAYNDIEHPDRVAPKKTKLTFRKGAANLPPHSLTIVHVPAQSAEESTTIDAETVKKWSAPYRNWHYHPDHVIPAKPNIKGFEAVHKTDVPTVFQLPGDKKWYMTFIGFDGKGYQSFIAQSDDLVHWTNMRLAMGYGPKDSFDHGGVVLGAYLYENYDIKAPRTLKKKEGKYFSLYGAYPRQGGYELRPGYEGVASSKNGLIWQRAKDQPILSVHQKDCDTWEKDCIYQPWLVEHKGKYYNFYNAANGHIEQMGLALSGDLLDWKRYEHNPVIPNGPKGSYNQKFSSDGKVFWDKDHWVNFFFGVGKGGAHIMAAFSRDLYHWTVDPVPLYKAGSNPSGLDRKYAHKISLVWEPAGQTYYMFYNAVGNKGRGIGLITSKPIVKQ